MAAVDATYGYLVDDMSTTLSISTDTPLRSSRRRAQAPTIRWIPAKAIEAKDRRSWRNA